MARGRIVAPRPISSWAAPRSLLPSGGPLRAPLQHMSPLARDCTDIAEAHQEVHRLAGRVHRDPELPRQPCGTGDRSAGPVHADLDARHHDGGQLQPDGFEAVVVELVVRAAVLESITALWFQLIVEELSTSHLGRQPDAS